MVKRPQSCRQGDASGDQDKKGNGALATEPRLRPGAGHLVFPTPPLVFAPEGGIGSVVAHLTPQSHVTSAFQAHP